jgi:hypothetical protein
MAEAFYGHDAFKNARKIFMAEVSSARRPLWILGYDLLQTLSEYGIGKSCVCEVNRDGNRIFYCWKNQCGMKDVKSICDEDLKELPLNTMYPWIFGAFIRHIWLHAKNISWVFSAIPKSKVEFFIPIVADQFIRWRYHKVIVRIRRGLA